MAIFSKGMRRITVDGIEYFWRFGDLVSIFLADGPFGQLKVDFGKIYGWGDMGDEEEKQTPLFEPKIMTPKYIRQAIVFARKTGWRDGTLELIYRNGSFKVQK